MHSQGFRTHQDYRNQSHRQQQHHQQSYQHPYRLRYTQPESTMGDCGVACAKYSVFIFNLFFGVSLMFFNFHLLFQNKVKLRRSNSMENKSIKCQYGLFTGDRYCDYCAWRPDDYVIS